MKKLLMISILVAGYATVYSSDPVKHARNEQIIWDGYVAGVVKACMSSASWFKDLNTVTPDDVRQKEMEALRAKHKQEQSELAVEQEKVRLAEQRKAKQVQQVKGADLDSRLRQKVDAKLHEAQEKFNKTLKDAQDVYHEAFYGPISDRYNLNWGIFGKVNTGKIQCSKKEFEAKQANAIQSKKNSIKILEKAIKADTKLAEDRRNQSVEQARQHYEHEVNKAYAQLNEPVSWSEVLLGTAREGVPTPRVAVKVQKDQSGKVIGYKLVPVNHFKLWSMAKLESVLPDISALQVPESVNTSNTLKAAGCAVALKYGPGMLNTSNKIRALAIAPLCALYGFTEYHGCSVSEYMRRRNELHDTSLSAASMNTDKQTKK